MDEKLQKSKNFLSDSYKSQFAKIDLDSFPSVFQRRKEEGLMLSDWGIVLLQRSRTQPDGTGESVAGAMEPKEDKEMSTYY